MLKIRGLVRASNSIRSHLQAGLRSEDVEQFRMRVRRIVLEVEEICSNYGLRPNQLPGPSWMAYKFLKEIDLENLPMVREGEIAAKPSIVRIKNLVKIGEQFTQGLWQNLGHAISSMDEREKLKRAIEGHVSAVERICGNNDATPASLEGPSRQTYCWLKFLSIDNNLPLHLEALQRAKNAIRDFQVTQQVILQMTCMTALWRNRQHRNGLLIKVNEAFLGADKNVWEAIIWNATILRLAEYDERIMKYAESDDFGELLDEIDSFASPPPPPAQGRAHNLDESFERVNRSYFGGAMAKPKIVWNRTLTLRKFGHYQPSRDTVMISISLDDLAVPDFVLDFVVYHELLHKKHGATTINGRRQAHSPAFRADERLFHQFKEAELFIHQLALKHRGLIK